MLKHMVEAGRISETDADAVQQQYPVFLDEDEVIKQSSQFNATGSSTQQRDRVDRLFYDSRVTKSVMQAVADSR